MKKLKVLTVALLLATAGVFASNVNPEPEATDVRSQIVTLLDAPTFSLDRTVNVVITFTFSSKGEIVVLNVNSTNEKVLDYVRENLNYKKIENPGRMHKTYTMPLKIAAS